MVPDAALRMIDSAVYTLRISGRGWSGNHHVPDVADAEEGRLPWR